MNKIFTIILLGSFVASPASALAVGARSDTSADVNVTSGLSGQDAEIYVSSETRLESSASTSANSGTGTETEAAFEIDAIGPTVIVASDVEDDMEADLSAHSSAEVSSQATLNSYARSIVKANTDIRDVILSDSEVSVSHHEYARLLGIIPIKVFARARVASNGNVKVEFPWYVFAAAKKASLESRIAADLNTSVPSLSASAQASAKLSAQTQAEILEKTVAAMKTEFKVDATERAGITVE